MDTKKRREKEIESKRVEKENLVQKIRRMQWDEVQQLHNLYFFKTNAITQPIYFKRKLYVTQVASPFK